MIFKQKLQDTQWLYSKYSLSRRMEYSICAEKLNAWCSTTRLFGEEPVALHPNEKGSPWPSMRFEESIPAGFDSLSLIVSTTDERAAGVKIFGRLLDHDGHVRDAAFLELHGQQEAPMQFSLPADTERFSLELSLGCSSYVPNNGYAKVFVRDCIAYSSDPLTQLADFYGSDKGVSCGVWGRSPHGYSRVYHDLFCKHRFDELAFLEIGLQASTEDSGVPDDAPSLRMWRDYFPNAKLFGFDKNNFSFFSQEKTTVLQGDQGKVEDLKTLAGSCGKDGFSVIIDDGSHMSSHQQITLAWLFPVLQSGGLYIIEDLSWQPKKESISTKDLFNEYFENRNMSSEFINDDQMKFLLDNIDDAVILKPNDMEILVIRKKVSCPAVMAFF